MPLLFFSTSAFAPPGITILAKGVFLPWTRPCLTLTSLERFRAIPEDCQHREKKEPSLQTHPAGQANKGFSCVVVLVPDVAFTLTRLDKTGRVHAWRSHVNCKQGCVALFLLISHSFSLKITSASCFSPSWGSVYSHMQPNKERIKVSCLVVQVAKSGRLSKSTFRRFVKE